MQTDVNIQYKLPAGTSCKKLLVLSRQKKLSQSRLVFPASEVITSARHSQSSMSITWAVVVLALKLKIGSFSLKKLLQNLLPTFL